MLFTVCSPAPLKHCPCPGAAPPPLLQLKIADAGAIPLLVACLRSPSDATRKVSASALWNLAYRNNANRRAIALAGAIPPLVALLGDGASEGCRQEAARALSNLSCNNEYNQGVSGVEWSEPM